MAWADVTRQDVPRAIRECDRLERAEFLKMFGFRVSKRYYIQHNGNYYDSKPIWAVAYGYRFPSEGPLRWNDFKGRSGKGGTEHRLKQLGFRVVRRAAIPL